MCANGSCCQQQSSANRIFNAGFNSSLDGWLTTKGIWTSQDADGCVSSGSVSFLAADAGTFVSSCITVEGGGQYNFGARAKVPATTAAFRAVCELFFYTGLQCNILSSGDNSASTSVFSTNSTDWQTMEMAVTLPPDIHTATVDCGPGGTGGSGTFLFDQVFLSKAPGKF
jgi:hypothetical protein